METSIRALFFYDVERKFEKFIASGGSADKVLTGRKRTVLAASLDKLITMQGWLKENLTEVWVEEVWHPSFHDCNPFDSFVWGVSELRVNSKSQNKFKDLIQKIKEMMGSLARDTLTKICMSFRCRIKAVFTADGNFIV
jgi:hypothetical protein